MEVRTALALIWLVAVLLAQVMRLFRCPNAAGQFLGMGAWLAFACAQWLRAPSATQVDPWQMMALVVGAALVGGSLAAMMGLLSLANMGGLWWAKAHGLVPEALLGRSPEAALADGLGMAVFAIVGVGAVLHWMVRLSESERRQSALAAGSAEKFKALFLDSPTPMALVEVDRRARPAGFAPPDKRKVVVFGPRILAINGAFAATFESAGAQGPSRVSELWRYGEDFEEIEKRLLAKGVVKGSKAFMVSCRTKRKMVCLASASRSMWEGAQAVLWTFQDVTEIELLRHRLERQNQALAEKLESTALEARYDALTLLPNRRALEERVAIADEMRHGGSLCAFMVDVDCFKKYNDSLGHPAGDGCLSKIGEALASVAAEWGERAFAARYGGEEFTLLLLGATLKESRRAGQSICDAVGALRMAHPNNDAGPVVTVSVGGSMRREGESTMEALKRADSALYQSKMQGRNRAQVDPEGLTERG